MKKKINCLECKHFRRNKWGTCDAFENGIPIGISFGQVRHTAKYPGQDNDILFEPIEEKK